MYVAVLKLKCKYTKSYIQPKISAIRQAVFRTPEDQKRYQMWCISPSVVLVQLFAWPCGEIGWETEGIGPT